MGSRFPSGSVSDPYHAKFTLPETVEARPSGEPSEFLMHDREVAIAVIRKGSLVPFDFLENLRSRQYAVGEVSTHFGVGIERGQIVQIPFSHQAQAEALSDSRIKGSVCMLDRRVRGRIGLAERHSSPACRSAALRRASTSGRATP